MEKLDMKSKDLSQEHIAEIRKLFPNAVTEVEENGKLILTVDFDILKQELSSSLTDAKEERYQMTWPGKRSSIVLSNEQTTKVLRPNIDGSIDFDKTKNLFIEGDNLDVLKVLRETYLGKVKMVYIDPPYNTGNDFVYDDDYSEDMVDFLKESGQNDDVGNRLVTNSDANGRFHSDWLSMIYPRLRLARDLLSQDGAIFISIDDHEIGNLLKICDEVFGNQNRVACIPWQSRLSIQNDTDFSINHEYIVFYAKNRRQVNRRLKESNAREWFRKDSFVCRPLPLDESKFSNPDNDPRGPWKADPMDAPNVRTNLTYVIKNPYTGQEYFPPTGRHWRTEKSTFEKWLSEGRIIFGKNNQNGPQVKSFYNEKNDFGSIDTSWFDGAKVGTATGATKELQRLFGDAPFDTPKPTSMLKKIINLAYVEDNDIVLDFFAGSCTTADAVMQLNASDQMNRHFIMVQIPEPCPKESQASKDGYNTICDIGKERIKRAGQELLKANGLLADGLDVGFRDLIIDSSNMKDIYYSAGGIRQGSLDDYTSNIKDDRKPLDLVFQVMLDLGVSLSSSIEEKRIQDKDVFFVGGNNLVACFDSGVGDDVLEELAKSKPLYACFRDSTFGGDSSSVNCEQIFKTISPVTKIKVL